MRRRGSGEGNTRFFTTSPDALSLATNRGRKVETNQGNGAKRKEEKEKYREANGVKEEAQCQAAPPDPASAALVLLPQPYYLPRLFKREVCDSTLNIKHRRHNNPTVLPTVLRQHPISYKIRKANWQKSSGPTIKSNTRYKVWRHFWLLKYT